MKDLSAQRCRYAAHRLEFGRFYMRYPLIEMGENGEIVINSFSQEIERTVFLSGTIKLSNLELSSDELDKKEVSLDEMKSLIEEAIGIEVVLPEIVHG